MHRREFLLKSAGWALGGVVGSPVIFRGLVHAARPPRSADPPRAALIIDDIGASPRRARQFLDLRLPVTFAILPRLEYSWALAETIHQQGCEIMLHQPMEPLNPRLSPGPGALYMGYDAKKIVRIMEENIARAPFAIGVNNHMGSRFTQGRREMEAVLGVVKQKDLYFVDSLTTGQSRGYNTARGLNITAARRNVFLDNVPEEARVRAQLRKLILHARRHGRAVGIGHPHPATARAIKSFKKEFASAGVSLAPMSRILSSPPRPRKM
ncbi:MAG: divergent polysaccharide deacetylase family protein [Desulfobacterales bacterium]|nr:divergent polysaccharide deacetylase family protein [Desulfobacterales bacterium]